MRQHVNPLSRFFQLPLKLPEPKNLFSNPSQPIHLDIGSARGKFLLSMASIYSDVNYLGVEIRRPLVEASSRECKRMALDNLCFLFCNANVSLQDWLNEIPKDILHFVSIQFPDPWLKRRHQKRRVLQPELLISLAESLQSGRQLFIQSDLLVLIKPMVLLIELSNCFVRHESCREGWLAKSPFIFSTERENYVLEKGLPVYRVLYCRNDMPVPDLVSLQNKWNEVKCFEENRGLNDFYNG